MIVEQIQISPANHNRFPFNLKLFKKDVTLSIDKPVTVFMGENGTGKSSLMKLIQDKLGLIRIQTPKDDIMPKLDIANVSILPAIGRKKGFFFESQAFINYINYIQKEISDSQAEIERIDQEYKGHSDYARMMAKSPHARTISELENMYERDLSRSSHGESFLDFFASRIKDNQIYLLDEPETPLSVQNQLTLVAMIMDACKQGCQFIIATHSPIIAAIPDAIIFEIKNDEFIRTEYEEIESISLMKQFLENRDQFLRHLK